MADSPRTKNMSAAWDFLIETTKRRSRYFFHAMKIKTSAGKTKTPNDILKLLRALSCENDLRISLTTE